MDFQIQTNIWIMIIWLVFAVLFGLLSYHYWRLSKKLLPPFQPPEIPYWELPPGWIPVNIGVTAKDIKKAFDDFNDGFNSYIKEYNESSSRQNRLQALICLLACLTALGSLFTSLLITI